MVLLPSRSRIGVLATGVTALLLAATSTHAQEEGETTEQLIEESGGNDHVIWHSEWHHFNWVQSVLVLVSGRIE